MNNQNNIYDTSHGERTRVRMQITYKKETCRKQLFMTELKEIRREVDKTRFKNVKKMIGPTWYQVLSVQHRQALDTLSDALYQDLLEGRPIRVSRIIKILGIFPMPTTSEIERCEYIGRDDAKEMLAQIFQTMYGHPIDVQRSCYCLNARLVLSSILYLGMKNLIALLEEKFRPDQTEKPKPPKVKPKPELPLESPYLQKIEAPMYLPSRPKPFEPLPLPNLDFLNEPYEEYHVSQISSKPPPLPPVPPPPKKRLARSYCDKQADVRVIEPYSSYTDISLKPVKRTFAARKSRRSSRNTNVMEVKRTTLGFDITTLKKRLPRKPKAPKTDQDNAQYVINGVYKVGNKTTYVLGNVSITPPQGDIIHGGIKQTAGGNVNIHLGIRGFPTPPAPDPCDCAQIYSENIFNYVKSTKCVCGHYYDYGNEGTFSEDEIKFFHPPDRNSPYRFDYAAIFNINPKSIHVEKEFKKIWDREDMLQKEGVAAKIDPKEKMRQLMLSTRPCIDENSRPDDYLRCALRRMRALDVAARLPDVHLVPELVEWMRRRLYGPLPRRKRDSLVQSSEKYWAFLRLLADKVSARTNPPKDARFHGHSNWRYKFSLNKEFRKYTEDYKLRLFRAQAMVNNMMWPSMYQAMIPDKKFREIYTSYLFWKPGDMTLMRPYTSAETLDRAKKMALRRYCCPPSVQLEE